MEFGLQLKFLVLEPPCGGDVERELTLGAGLPSLRRLPDPRIYERQLLGELPSRASFGPPILLGAQPNDAPPAERSKAQRVRG